MSDEFMTDYKRDTIEGLVRQNERLLGALRRIRSLEEKNVPKYAQQIAREALSFTSGIQGGK